MEISEKIKICSTCKNREFNPSCGIVCSLTKEKPAFEHECDKYIADEAQIAQQAESMRQLDEENDVSGWLAVFLWLGLCGGAILSVGSSIVNTIGQGWFVAVLQILCLIPPVLTAFLAIHAFYKRKSNAVSLAKTYIAMICMDAACAMAVSIILEDTSMIMHVIRNLIWATIWLTYLCQSEKVNVVIPKSIRVWKAPEKILLSIFVVVSLAFVSLTAIGKYL